MKWTNLVNWHVLDTKIKTFWLKVTEIRANSKVTPNLKVTEFIKSHYEQKKVL